MELYEKAKKTNKVAIDANDQMTNCPRSLTSDKYVEIQKLVADTVEEDMQKKF